MNDQNGAENAAQFDPNGNGPIGNNSTIVQVFDGHNGDCVVGGDGIDELLDNAQDLIPDGTISIGSGLNSNDSLDLSQSNDDMSGNGDISLKSVKRGRDHPKGSKNKSKSNSATASVDESKDDV